MTVAALLLFACGGCSQPWVFYHGEGSRGGELLGLALPLPTEDPGAAASPSPVRAASFEQPLAPPGLPLPAPPSQPPTPASTAIADGPQFFPDVAGPEFRPLDDPLVQRLPPVPGGTDDAHQPGATHFGAMIRAEGRNIWSDHRNYYSWPGLRDFGLVVGVAAVSANTSMDSHFRNWYQEHARTDWEDNLADAGKFFGDGWTFIPLYIGLSVVGQTLEDYKPLGVLGEFGDRAGRACLVGAPPMLLMQRVTGGGRPVEAPSRWTFFEGIHGVSGHAFMGAIPFITAAKMADNPWAKGCFYVASVVPAWSRINDDRHYVSQVWMGWWMAYLACRAVDGTQEANRALRLDPLITPEMTGVGVTYQR